MTGWNLNSQARKKAPQKKRRDEGGGGIYNYTDSIM